jgi:hypothetical protein
MSKFDISFSATAVVFVDSKGKAESVSTFESMSPVDALRALDKAFKADKSASEGAVSALNDILSSPRLDGYKGVTPVNEAIPNELKSAIRELEVEYFKPVFTAYHADKGAKPATIEKQWQLWAGDLKAAGSYAVAKTFVTRYFAYCGKLPLCENGQLLTVAAIKKLLENVEKPAHTQEGIAGKLVKIAAELTTADADKMGDFATAIAALKSMLSTYELQHAQALEALTDAIGNVEITEASKPAMVRAPAPSIAEQAQAITDKAYLSTKHARHANLTHNDTALV